MGILSAMLQRPDRPLTAQLLALLRDVLKRWQGKTPRLVYVTDAGNHPQDFYRSKLCGMKHPRTGEVLVWEWIVDYYHACERITRLAEAIYRFKQSGMRWKRDQGQHVLGLQVVLKSGVWEICRTRWLANYTPVETVTPTVTRGRIHTFHGD